MHTHARTHTHTLNEHRRIPTWLYMHAYTGGVGRETNGSAGGAHARTHARMHTPPHRRVIWLTLSKTLRVQVLVKQSVLDACSMQNLEVPEIHS